LQALLTRAGHPVKVDGDFGTATKDAVKAFQKKQRIKADGVVGPETVRRLEEWKVTPEETPGEIAATDVPEVKDAAKGLGLLGFVTAIRDQVAETASYLTGIDADVAQTAANVLLAGSGIIGVGLAVWGVWGWWRSRQTDEGDVVA
jgi:peptidoglycan hydrolase-like protein with peptidoglycan-binding domain